MRDELRLRETARAVAVVVEQGEPRTVRALVIGCRERRITRRNRHQEIGNREARIATRLEAAIAVAVPRLELDDAITVEIVQTLAADVVDVEHEHATALARLPQHGVEL